MAHSANQVDMNKITIYTTSSSGTRLSKSPSPHPDATWNEQRAFAFFHQRTAYHISGCHNSGQRWFNYLLAVGESEPAIKHGVVALGSLHEEFEALARPPYASYTPLQTLPTTHLAVQQYEKALQLVAAAPPWQNKDTPLLACLLFSAFDSLRGRPEPALFHRCSGLRILSETSFDPQTPLKELMVCVFLNFDTENLELGEPAFFGNYGWPFSFPLITRPLIGFSRLKDAIETFEMLFNRILRAVKQPLRIRGPRSGVGPNPRLPDILLRYSEWCYALDEYLRAAAMSVQNIDQDGISDLVVVQLRRLLMRVILHVDIRHSEMDFDRFMPDFAAMVELAESFANGCTRVSEPQRFEPIVLPPSTLVHELDRVHQKSPDASTMCPLARPTAATPPASASSSDSEEERPFSGPRRQFLGIIAGNTPIISPYWPTVDGAATASALLTLARLPRSSPSPSPSRYPSPASSNSAAPSSSNASSGSRSGMHSHRYARSTFSLSPAIISPMYITATHCRDPNLRRRALHVLEAAHRKEGQWDSLVCAANARAVLAAEESRAAAIMPPPLRTTPPPPTPPTGEGVVGAHRSITIPAAARVREIEAVMRPEGDPVTDGRVRAGELKRFEWRAVGDGWSVVVPGCTTQ